MLSIKENLIVLNLSENFHIFSDNLKIAENLILVNVCKLLRKRRKTKLSAVNTYLRMTWTKPA